MFEHLANDHGEMTMLAAWISDSWPMLRAWATSWWPWRSAAVSPPDDFWEPCAEGCPGWAVFESSAHGFEVQRCDDCSRFTNDDEALDYVVSHPEAARLCIDQLFALLNELDNDGDACPL